MQTYRVFHLSAGRRVTGVTELKCRDDAAAISQAQLIENEHGLELWSRARLIRVFPPLTLAPPQAERAA